MYRKNDPPREIVGRMKADDDENDENEEEEEENEGELLVRHYELRFVCRTPQRCRQCIRLQPATSPQEGCNTSLPTRQFGNLSAERCDTSGGCADITREVGRGWDRDGMISAWGRGRGGRRGERTRKRGRVRSLQPLSIPRGLRCN